MGYKLKIDLLNVHDVIMESSLGHQMLEDFVRNSVCKDEVDVAIHTLFCLGFVGAQIKVII